VSKPSPFEESIPDVYRKAMKENAALKVDLEAARSELRKADERGFAVSAELEAARLRIAELEKHLDQILHQDSEWGGDNGLDEDGLCRHCGSRSGDD